VTEKVVFPYTESNTSESYFMESISAATSTPVKLYKITASIPSRFSKPSIQGDRNNPKGITEITTLSQSIVISKRNRSVISDNMLLSSSKIKPVDIKGSVSIFSKAKSTYAKQEIANFTSSKIPSDSPIYSLQNLQKGWDGYWAEPLSPQVLLRAHELWMRIKQITRIQGDLPSISPAANGSVAFTWSSQYPRKELEIWLYDQLDYYAEWLFSVEGNDREGDTQYQAQLLKVIRQYQEF